MKRPGARIAWLAGTRSQLLRIGPIFAEVARHSSAGRSLLLVHTAEQGMAADQALDQLGLAPHVTFDLRPPGEDPAHRLHGLMVEIEALARHRRFTHLVFAGAGPTAAAAALVCLARQCRGLWLKPLDPCRLIPRLRWEHGLARLIESMAPLIQPLEPDPTERGEEPAERGTSPAAPTTERSPRPRVIIDIGRPLWGIQRLFDTLVNAAVSWARNVPEADWILLRTLDARLEGPLNCFEGAPANFRAELPRPLPEFQVWLEHCAAILTDSCHLAAEAVAMEIPVAALGETPSEGPACRGQLRHLTPADLTQPGVVAFFKEALERARPEPRPRSRFWRPSAELIGEVLNWLERAGRERTGW